MSIGPLEATQRPPPPSRTPDVPAQKGEPTEEASPFARMLHGLGREMTRGEATMRNALRAGGNMGPSELLALQANIYRYSEAVDLAAKLVDRASTGIKTVIQGQ